MGLKFSNFGKAVISSAPTGTAGLSFTVEAGKGLLFPSLGSGDYFYGIFKDSSGNREVVKIDARSTDAMTIATGGRGIDGTTARTWAAGDYFVAGICNIALQELFNPNWMAIGTLPSAADKLPYFTGSGTADITTFTPFARTLLDDTDAATMRTTIGAVSKTGAETIAGSKTFSDRMVPSQTNGIAGTNTNDSVVAGGVGEHAVSTVSVGSAIGLVTNVPLNVASVVLTAGDWDVYGNVLFLAGASTNITSLQGSISTTSVTADATAKFVHSVPSGMVTGAVSTGFEVPAQRLSLAGSTTVYLIATAKFTVSTLAAYGRVWARRAR